MTTSTTPRARNPRGQGGRLREEIVDAACRIVVREGSAEAITLRAVAREAGISAPSIYAHFPHAGAIIEAVVDRTFEDLAETLLAAATPEDPIRRLHAGCRSYLEFAKANPQRYALLFCPPAPGDLDEGAPDEAFEGSSGAAAFQVLVDCVSECVRAGRSTSTDPFLDSVSIWVALHGYAGLRNSTSDGFPWPPEATQVDSMVSALARLT